MRPPHGWHAAATGDAGLAARRGRTFPAPLPRWRVADPGGRSRRALSSLRDPHGDAKQELGGPGRERRALRGLGATSAFATQERGAPLLALVCRPPGNAALCAAAG